MVKANSTEYELLRQLIEGDAHAFKEIYELYQDKIYAFAYKLTKQKHVADDMVQEVFIKLWEKRDQVKVELNFGAYLNKMTQNHIFNYLKKASHDKALQQTIRHQMEALQNSNADEMLEKELQKVYAEAIETLSPQKKLIYTLSRTGDLSYDEIARQLNISRNTVRNQMVDAIRLIRQYVAGHSGLTSIILAICIGKT
ncbi:MAG: RNA polymerase sigma-70 factor [Chitinophagaceae bacterium]